MTTPTSVQIIEQNGQPLFAVIPYADYLAGFGNRGYQSASLQGDSLFPMKLCAMFCVRTTLWPVHGVNT
jgi:hypothetical protein